MGVMKMFFFGGVMRCSKIRGWMPNSVNTLQTTELHVSTGWIVKYVNSSSRKLLF